MNCPMCYYTVKDGVNFCPNCGEPLTNGAVNANPYIKNSAEAENSGKEPEEQNSAPKAQTEPTNKYSAENPYLSVAYDNEKQESAPEPRAYDNEKQESVPEPQADLEEKKESIHEFEEKSTSYTAQEPLHQRPMKWYKFMIYFALFAGAVLNLINGFRYLTGSIYMGSQAAVYSSFPNLKTLDITMGLGLIALAVLVFVTRNALAKFKSSGPKLLTATYIVNIALSVLYYAVSMSILAISGASGITDLISSCAGTLVMLIVNRVYFKNRRYMFVN